MKNNKINKQYGQVGLYLCLFSIFQGKNYKSVAALEFSCIFLFI
jgi:hypothetical protein